MRLLLAILIIATAALAAGCSGGGKTQQPVAAGTLPLDPTQEIMLAEWWTNGKQLLQLGRDGVFRLYDGIDRYHTPLKRGHWWQQSYATIWLDAYGAEPRQPTRVSMHRDGARLELEFGHYQPMTALDAPPEVIEDRLFGRWIGSAGALALYSDLRYSFLPKSAPRSGPAELASQEGGWSVEKDLLILQPDSAGVRRTLMRILDQDESITLETADGRLVRSPSPLEDG